MRNLLNPKWLLIINTLPIILLFLLSYGQYNIIKSQLDENYLQAWTTFGIALASLGFLNILYAVYSILNEKKVIIWYGFISLIIHISFLYAIFYNYNKFIPPSIPNWMIVGSLPLYALSFLMPTIIYALFVMVYYLTPEEKEQKAWINFLIALAIPAAGYLFIQIILPLLNKYDDEFLIHGLVVLTILASILFIFFIARGVLVVLRKKSGLWKKYELFWKILFALVLPVFGLLINNGYFGSTSFNELGDFSSYWFLLLAIINGTLLCIPNSKNKKLRLWLFVGRSITYTYTLYFFIVFLPFLPFSIIFILLMGLGFLFLTPLILFILHTYELNADYSFLKSTYNNKLLASISTVGFLVIPIIITLFFLRDKHILNETLDYVYAPNYSKNYNINRNSLESTLNEIKKHKSRRSNDDFLESATPFISSYYNWLVLDNLTLSDSKINKIEDIFFENLDIRSPRVIVSRNRSDDISISKVTTGSRFDRSQKAFITLVKLELSPNNLFDDLGTYSTQFTLPDGCWISDYYLIINGIKEKGILAEKKSAMWVYSQITDVNRDPGILNYKSGNEIEFRVFPFSSNEIRETGIEFIHKEPLEINIDGQSIKLGISDISDELDNKINEIGNVAFVSSKQKENLKLVKRKPYLHFLVDVSNHSNSKTSDYAQSINKAIKKYSALSNNAQISLVNSYVKTYQISDDWKTELNNQPFEGGFFLDRAIRKSLVQSYQKAEYPILVVVTDNMEEAILDVDFSDLQFTFPESNLFYVLSPSGELVAHSLIKDPLKSLDNLQYDSVNTAVREYSFKDGFKTYLPNNNLSSVAYNNFNPNVSENEINDKNWASGLIMQGLWANDLLHPEKSDDTWLDLVKYSFKSQIMNPYTSYIALENEAQKEMLLKKQKEVLSGKKSLDLEEERRQMSEPEWLYVLVGFILLIGYRKYRSKKMYLIK